MPEMKTKRSHYDREFAPYKKEPPQNHFQNGSCQSNM